MSLILDPSDTLLQGANYVFDVLTDVSASTDRNRMIIQNVSAIIAAIYNFGQLRQHAGSTDPVQTAILSKLGITSSNLLLIEAEIRRSFLTEVGIHLDSAAVGLNKDETGWNFTTDDGEFLPLEDYFNLDGPIGIKKSERAVQSFFKYILETTYVRRHGGNAAKLAEWIDQYHKGDNFNIHAGSNNLLEGLPPIVKRDSSVQMQGPIRKNFVEGYLCLNPYKADEVKLSEMRLKKCKWADSTGTDIQSSGQKNKRSIANAIITNSRTSLLSMIIILFFLFKYGNIPDRTFGEKLQRYSENLGKEYYLETFNREIAPWGTREGFHSKLEEAREAVMARGEKPPMAPLPPRRAALAAAAPPTDTPQVVAAPAAAAPPTDTPQVVEDQVADQLTKALVFGANRIANVYGIEAPCPAAAAAAGGGVRRSKRKPPIKSSKLRKTKRSMRSKRSKRSKSYKLRITKKTTRKSKKLRKTKRKLN